MGGKEYIKIPSNMFELDAFEFIDDSTILLYLDLLCAAYKCNKKGIFQIAGIQLTNEILSNIFRCDRIDERMKVLEDNGLIIREERQVKVLKAWESTRNRSSADYKEWRIAVFSRDGFKCQSCGSKEDIQAHHIKHWKDNKSERYVVSNGVTLCRKCHLKAHNGRWN